METPKKSRPTAVYVLMAALAVAAAGSAYFGYRHLSTARLETHMQTWSEAAKLAAKLMTERYGPPDALAPWAATWNERENWKRITVRGDLHANFLEQTISYQAPPEAITPLRAFGHVQLDVVNEELTAASGEEAMNYLALNLADEIARGTRTLEEARAHFTRTVKLSVSGKSSPYLENLLFAPHRR